MTLASIFSLCGPGGEIGRRKGLKIPRPKGHAGSSPALGTTHSKGFSDFRPEAATQLKLFSQGFSQGLTRSLAQAIPQHQSPGIKPPHQPSQAAVLRISGWISYSQAAQDRAE